MAYSTKNIAESDKSAEQQFKEFYFVEMKRAITALTHSLAVKTKESVYAAGGSKPGLQENSDDSSSE